MFYRYGLAGNLNAALALYEPDAVFAAPTTDGRWLLAIGEPGGVGPPGRTAPGLRAMRMPDNPK